MVKAIVFDCFGVLTTEAWLPFKAKYFANDPELLEKAGELSNKANRGLISHFDFIEGVAKLAGISPESANAFISRNVADEELFKYIKVLKKKYKIGFLSNIAEDYLHRMFTEDQLSIFDVIELSYKTGFIKPQVQSYKLIADKLDVEPKEALMVDDQQRNILGAKEAGMKGILYRDIDQFKQEIKEAIRD